MDKYQNNNIKNAFNMTTCYNDNIYDNNKNKKKKNKKKKA